MKKSIFLGVIALICAACSTATPPAATIPPSGYKQNLSNYTAAQNQKPSASLWANAGNHGTLFLDYKARLVGDIITIKIVENARASNSNNTSTSKSSNYDASITSIMGLPLDLGINNVLGTGGSFDPTLAASTNNTFAGTGSKAKNDSITATISARVVEVQQPTGNLVIEGQREIIVDQEKQTITIRGIVRPKDINANNEVESTSIAEAQIAYSGDGVISDANRKGWLAVFIDWIWPF